LLDTYPIVERTVVYSRRPFQIHGITLEAFPVEHSIRAPAVGYRITAGRSTVFYVPDVIYIHDAREALFDITLYIGDGACLRRPIIRKRGNKLVGHAPLRTQLEWCERERVPRVLVTHCGSEIVGANPRTIAKSVYDLGLERGITAQIAFDSLEVKLP
jgi:hypothetical protein